MKKRKRKEERELVGGPSYEEALSGGGILREEFIPNVTYSLLARTEKTAGKAPVVFLVIHQLCFMRKCKTVKVESSRLVKVGVSRKQKSRALKSLEKAGLISVDRPDGENPVVTLLEG
jgi:hypothetical protein